MAKKTKAKRTSKSRKKNASAKVPLHTVVHFMRMLHKRKHSARFMAHAKKEKGELSVTVPAEAVDFINRFRTAHRLESVALTPGADPCPTEDPWKCPRR
jgi:hypothetical protein